MWLEVGDEVLNKRDQRGVVLEVNDTDAKVQFENDDPPGWSARRNDDGPLEFV
jgi:hypothetical protein